MGQKKSLPQIPQITQIGTVLRQILASTGRLLTFGLLIKNATGPCPELTLPGAFGCVANRVAWSGGPDQGSGPPGLPAFICVICGKRFLYFGNASFKNRYRSLSVDRINLELEPTAAGYVSSDFTNA